MNVPVCGAKMPLPPSRIHLLHHTPDNAPVAEPGEVNELLHCTLEKGHVTPHHGIARSLPLTYPGEVWASWHDKVLLDLSPRPDCPARERDGDACHLFSGHAGAHSWELDDPHVRVPSGEAIHV